MSDVYNLIEQAQHMEYGPERVAVAEEAVRQANLSGDEYLGFQAREELVESAYMSGEADKMLPAFAWRQDYAARTPDLSPHDLYQLAWQHKWALSAALNFPQVPLERIHALHQNFMTLARSMGDGHVSGPYMGLELAMHLGDKEAAAKAYSLWQMAKANDDLSDCPACEAQTRVEYQEFMGDDEAAVREGRKIIEGQRRCAEVPHKTYASLLMPLLRQGEAERAREYAAKGRRLVSGKSDHLTEQAEHLEYLALTNLGAARKWYARHLPWAEKTREPDVQFDFHAASALLFTQLQNAGKETVALDLPEQCHGYAESGEYAASERLAYHEGEARRIAALFDERGGTDAFARRLEQTLALTEFSLL